MICRICKNREGAIKNYKQVNRDGTIVYHMVCSKCQSERLRKYRQTKNGKMVFRKIMQKQYKVHRLKILARVKLNYALKKGKMKKPLICSKCLEDKKLEAHHEDYSFPLQVIWLCRSCHSELYKKS